MPTDPWAFSALLGPVGWGIAWLLFRGQFGAMDSKIDKLAEKLGDIHIAIVERLAKVEGQVESLTSRNRSGDG